MIFLHGKLALMRRMDLLPDSPPVLTRGVRALTRPLFRPNLDSAVRAANSLLANPLLPPGSYDGGKQMGPPNCVAVAPKGGAPYKTIAVGRGQDPAHVEPVLCELYRATGDRKWLDKLAVYGHPAPNLAAKLDWCVDVLNQDIPWTDREWNVETAGLLESALA
jgi:hypothetical protein